MKNPFDHVANTYDSVFTYSPLGMAQRRYVWSYLEKIIPELNGSDVLEFNCGTGEDALLFGARGFKIMATDISSEMLKMTQKKIESHGITHLITSQHLDLRHFDEAHFNKKFDLVFSNFGGLNCIDSDSLKQLLVRVPQVLSPGGRFVAVIMPKICLWETTYFLMKLQFKKAFRRFMSKEVLANLDGVDQKTWYYNPSQIRQFSNQRFEHKATLPIGIAMPPSYLNKLFSSRKKWLSVLDRWEKKLNQIAFLSGMADHYIIDLKLK